MDFPFLERWQPQILAALRIMTGLLFMEHGAVKLLHFPVGMEMPTEGFLMILLYTAGALELVGGALVTVGLFTRLTAFILSGQMAIAYFLGHVLRGGFWPVQNRGEAAILFCFIFLYLASAGAGAWSFDGARKAEPVPA